MPDSGPRIVHAWLDSLQSGVVEFDRNWEAKADPQLTLGPDKPDLLGLAPAPQLVVAKFEGYCLVPDGEIIFVHLPGGGGDAQPGEERVFLAGEFNGWQRAVGDGEWELRPAELDGERVLLWRGPAGKVLGKDPVRFKFVTGDHLWLGVPNDAPNRVRDDAGNINRLAHPSRTGRHLWRFTVEKPLDLGKALDVRLSEARPDSAVSVGLGDFFHQLGTNLPLGARVGAGRTHFRLFAPRAGRVTVHFCPELADQEKAETLELVRRPDGNGAQGLWEGAVERKLHGWFYWYTLEGANGGPGGFDPAARILDPYAVAAVGPAGPGIILSPEWLGRADRTFRAPAWQDLVMAEAHVRDLAANAPVVAGPEERRGFTGLQRWVESPEFYLHALGVNCVELQPVQQSDNPSPEKYHWGYMTTNFFAPEAGYSRQPAAASGVRELRDLVAAFHRRGIAVVLDVVFNHVGEPAHLMAIDRSYYFEVDREGRLSNWSGCGNDLRAGAAMSRRLIIDSCVHLIEVYGVDGFRFDLAELLGVDVLREVEAALKRTKPDVILIAEPWSFRGHIAGALRPTGWTSWNDGYREFVRGYVLGTGSASRLEYFLRGSPWYFARWPAQTVNYTQSHDDRSWIDAITENPGNDGFVPTANDRRRTHLMAACLFMSIGIPMVASGQDFLLSKRGVTNTYQRGDLNALDYRRLHRFLGTHAYFADWIDFRLGHHGRFLRQYARPSEGFFQFFRGAEDRAMAVLVNADGSQGPERLLFAVNPTSGDAIVPVGPKVAGLGRWRQLADQERFYSARGYASQSPVEESLAMPSLACGLWIFE